DARLFEEALDSVTTGWRLLDRARELLRDAPPMKPVTILFIPDWILMIILILIIVILVVLIVFGRYKKKLNAMFEFRKRAVKGPEITEVIGAGPPTSRVKEDIEGAARRQAERKKIEKVLDLLEREYKEGIISEKAYNELRKRNLEKLKEMGT
ncbi:MAG: hypothetical protein JSV63_03410, partial [Candidatus Aenigmatarchaeota archaeon]